jgi:hypothetical protein
MDQRLARLINDYLAAVFAAVKLLEQSGIVRPASNSEWAGMQIPQVGVLEGGVKYFKHGYGCAVHLQSGPVDFDFGDKGEINGFSVNGLAGFAGAGLAQYGFESATELETCFRFELTSGSIVKSDYILHYLRASDV